MLPSVVDTITGSLDLICDDGWQLPGQVKRKRFFRLYRPDEKVIEEMPLALSWGGRLGVGDCVM